jgi:hypothetical protein
MSRDHRFAPREQRGAALVEFAIVLTLFLTLVFGMVEFGIDYSNYVSVRNGSREAARMGVVNDLSGAPACSINGVTVTPPASPANTTDATNALICKAKNRIDLASSKIKIKVIVPPSAQIGQTLQICADYPVTSITGLIAPFVNGKTLVSSVTMRLEQVPKVTSFTETGATC